MSKSLTLIFLAAVSLILRSPLTASGYQDNSGTETPSGGPQDGSRGGGRGAGGPGGGPGGGQPHAGNSSGKGMAFKELDVQNSSRYFSDLDEVTFNINAYVDYLVQRGIIDVTDDSLFRPHDILTHMELAAMVDPLYENENLDFIRDDKPVTREELALWIFKGEIGKGMPRQMITDDVSRYSDVNLISKKAWNAVGTLSQMGLLVPDPNGKFNPGKTVIREEIPLILYKLSFLGSTPPAGEGGKKIN